MMRTILSFGFGALIALGIIIWIALLAFAWVVTSILGFLTWLASDGLPVTIGAAIVAAAVVAFAWWNRRRVAH